MSEYVLFTLTHRFLKVIHCGAMFVFMWPYVIFNILPGSSTVNYTSGWCCVTLLCISVLGYIRGEITGAVLIYLKQYILTTYLKAINQEAHCHIAHLKNSF